MWKLLLFISLGSIGYSAFATTGSFNCSGTYLNSQGATVEIPKSLGESGKGNTYLILGERRAPSPASVLNASELEMTFGAGTVTAKFLKDCSSFSVGGAEWKRK